MDKYKFLYTFIIIIAALVVAAGAVSATYLWQHDKVNTLNKSVNDLNAKLTVANNQIATLTNEMKKTCTPAPTTSDCAKYVYTSTKGVRILVFEPSSNGVVSSPIGIVGEVPGSWSFEAQFPVQLKDSAGHVIVQTPANVLGSWQTNQLQPFSAQLIYSSQLSGTGTIVLNKDNPSGLPENDDSVTIPIKFQ